MVQNMLQLMLPDCAYLFVCLCGNWNQKKNLLGNCQDKNVAMYIDVFSSQQWWDNVFRAHILKEIIILFTQVLCFVVVIFAISSDNSFLRYFFGDSISNSTWKTDEYSLHLIIIWYQKFSLILQNYKQF